MSRAEPPEPLSEPPQSNWKRASRLVCTLRWRRRWKRVARWRSPRRRRRGRRGWRRNCLPSALVEIMVHVHVHTCGSGGSRGAPRCRGVSPCLRPWTMDDSRAPPTAMGPVPPPVPSRTPRPLWRRCTCTIPWPCMNPADGSCWGSGLSPWYLTETDVINHCRRSYLQPCISDEAPPPFQPSPPDSPPLPSPPLAAPPAAPQLSMPRTGFASLSLFMTLVMSCGFIVLLHRRRLRLRRRRAVASSSEHDLRDALRQIKEALDALPPTPYRRCECEPCQAKCCCNGCCGGAPHDTGEECAICLGPFEVAQPVRKLPCSHWFHRRCIDRWLLGSSGGAETAANASPPSNAHASCPLCKTSPVIRTPIRTLSTTRTPWLPASPEPPRSPRPPGSPREGDPGTVEAMAASPPQVGSFLSALAVQESRE